MNEERVMRITHLRDSLGWAYREVVLSEKPIVVQRYKTQDVMLVPAWEWRFLKQIEADIRAGRCPWENRAVTSGAAERASGPAVPVGAHSSLAQDVHVRFPGERASDIGDVPMPVAGMRRANA